MVVLIVAFFTVAGTACAAVLLRTVGRSSRQASRAGGENELDSLRELVLELRRELRSARGEAERARKKAISSNVNLQRALGPGGDIEVVVARQVGDALARAGAGNVVRLNPTRPPEDHESLARQSG